jgi:winged helix-turn-helix DNA-binding protein
MSLVDELREMERQVTRRLQELEPMVAEYQELRKIAERIGEQVADATNAPKATKPRAKASAAAGRPARTRKPPRASKPAAGRELRGKRDEDIIRIVTEQPGITVAQVGKELGVDPTGLYRVVRRLQAAGRIRKQGLGLKPAA